MVVDVALGRVELVLRVFDVWLGVANWAKSGRHLFERRSGTERVSSGFSVRLWRWLRLHKQPAVLVTQTANRGRELLLWKAVKGLFKVREETPLYAGKLKLENAEVLIVRVGLLQTRLHLL